MLYVFGFERSAVVLSDLYFVDPNPIQGQESPEHGVRLEVRAITARPAQGVDLLGAAHRDRRPDLAR